jgi:hypothetical protein
MTTNQIINIQNPVPILQQERSSITTNPFIPNEQKEMELRMMDVEANKIIEEAYKKNKTTSISYLSIQDINKNISSSTIGVLDDLFKKPPHVPWSDYLLNIIQKDQRYTYIGVLLILIAIYMLIVS